MDNIILFSINGESVKLKLNTEKKPYIVEDILCAHNKVYGDLSYSLSINSKRDINAVLVYINGEQAETVYKAGVIEFYGDSEKPFLGIIGLVQISLCVEFVGAGTEWFYSEYASVLIKNTGTNRNLDTMLKYVYENQEEILYREVMVTDVGKGLDKTYDDFWSQIAALEEIANVYENSYGYFKANCRTKLENEIVLDRTEKLQEVGVRTLSYIVQHPEYLHNTVNGIKYGRRSFLPSKTLMTKKKITNDIYENQVVMSFLEHVSLSVAELTEKIRHFISAIQIENKTENGYIISSYMIYENAKNTLEEFLEKTINLQKQYQKLVMSFAQVLNVKRIPMIKMPEPTSVFMNLPQYHRIYTCVVRWFGKRGYELLNERVMLSFIDAPSVYEAYTLIKIINQIKDYGYTLESSRYVHYPKQSVWKYTNKKYNNTFMFSNESAKITLYYEPYIYNEDRSGVNNISIYRNNSVSLMRETEEERQGHYYVPDYVLKYEYGEKEKYFICDAKFSRKLNVQFKLMPELIYKYITSLSPINENAEIGGLYIFYGLDEGESDSASFYDRFIPGTKEILPLIEMIPLSEMVRYNKQQSNSIKMFKALEE